MYRISHLENGLTVVTAEMPHMTSVSLGIWIGVGSRYEPAELNGVCHFIEHVLFKGTRRRGAREISQAIEGIGGYLNAFTSEEATCFHARAAYSRWEDLLDVLTDMLLHSTFDPREIEKERDVIKEEIAMYLDEPQHHVQELLNETVWPDQPLGRPITGTTETLDRLDRSKLVGWLREKYVSGSTVITAAGNLRHAALARAVARRTRGWKRGQRPQFQRCHTDQAAPRVRLFSRKTEQTQLALGIRTASRHDRRRFALRLLNVILGENMSSHLFQSVREQHGLAYSIYSSTSFFDDAGDLVISAGLDADKLPKALKLISAEISRMREKAPSRSELRRARDYVIGQIELGSEATEHQMNWIGEQYLGYGRLFTPRMVKQYLVDVTPAEIQKAAREFLQPARASLALVSPLKSTTGLEKLLRF